MSTVLLSDSVFGRIGCQEVSHQAFFKKRRSDNAYIYNRAFRPKQSMTTQWTNLAQIGISGWFMSDGLPLIVKELLQKWFGTHETLTFLVSAGINDLR